MESRKKKVRGKLSLLLVIIIIIIVTFVMLLLFWGNPVKAPSSSGEGNESNEGNDQSVQVMGQPMGSDSDDSGQGSDEQEEERLEWERVESERLEQERLEAERLEKERLESERLELERLEEEKALLSFETSYYGELSSRLDISTEDWIIMPQIAAQGDVLLVRHGEAQEVIFGDHTYPMHPFGTGYYAYLPVPRTMAPGEYPLGDQVITIEAKQFNTQYLEVTNELEEMRRDQERIKADQIKVNEARSKSEPTFLFAADLEFLQPIEGRLTTPFGHTRYVNGVLSGSHMAIDLAMPQGTPIMATNSGVVVLSEELYLAGNSIYIDHGMGLFSQYGHLHELYVEAGDSVEQGEIIGTVGTTGFSTGPHLHFTFWVHNIPVNPNLFFGRTPFHWAEQGVVQGVVQGVDQGVEAE